MRRSAEPEQEDRNEQATTMLESVWGTLSLLNKQIKLERADGKVRVVLDDPAAAKRKAQASAHAEQVTSRMRDELTGLLDRCKGSRRSLPHLAGIEHALKTQGAGAFDGMPERVLARASQQLEAVLTEPVSAGLSDLRSRLVVAQTAAEEGESATTKNAGPSSFLTDQKLLVSEGSVSDFMRAVAEAEGKA
jgi:hypothetical protein